MPDTPTKPQNDSSRLDPEQEERRARRRKIRNAFFLCFAISAGLVVFALTWQQSYDLLGFCNAFYFSASLWFFAGWIILMINMNVLSPVIYGLKTFFLMFAAKKPKTDYYTYLEDRKNNPIPKFIVMTAFLACLPNVAVAVFLHLLLG